MANVAELLESLKSEDRKNFKDGYTLHELMAKNGKSRAWNRERLKVALIKGLLEIGKKKVMGLEGELIEETAYKFKVEVVK